MFSSIKVAMFSRPYDHYIKKMPVMKKYFFQECAGAVRF